MTDIGYRAHLYFCSCLLLHTPYYSEICYTESAFPVLFFVGIRYLFVYKLTYGRRNNYISFIYTCKIFLGISCIKLHFTFSFVGDYRAEGSYTLQYFIEPITSAAFSSSEETNKSPSPHTYIIILYVVSARRYIYSSTPSIYAILSESRAFVYLYGIFAGCFLSTLFITISLLNVASIKPSFFFLTDRHKMPTAMQLL